MKLRAIIICIRNIVMASLLALVPLCHATGLPGHVIAKLLTDSGVALHPATNPLYVEAKIQNIEHPAVVLEFDHRVITLGSPLHKLTIGSAVPAPQESKEDIKNQHLFDLHFVGESWKLDVDVKDDEDELDAPYPPPEGGCVVDVNSWRHTFSKQFRSLKIIDERTKIRRDDFNFETIMECMIFGLKPNVLVNYRLYTSNCPNMEKKAIEALVAAGYSRIVVEKTFSDLKAEFANMTDNDFSMQMLKSDGALLSKEVDLKNALRAMYFQCIGDPEYAFTTKFNNMAALVIKEKYENAENKFPFFYHISIMDEKGNEVQWVIYRLKEKIGSQAIADRLATLLADNKK